MKHTCILLLALAVTACHTDRDRNDDQWPAKSTTASTTPSSMNSQNNYGQNNQYAAQNSGQYGRTTDAAASEPKTKALSTDDRQFVTKATQGGLFEVQSSKVALEKNVSGPTHDFAQMMVDDHGKANRDLDSLVHKKGGTTSDTLDREHQAKLDELSALNGKEFERKFHDEQVKAHDEAIRLFEKESKEADDPDMRAFANRLLPTLRAHRKHLDEHPME